MLVSKRTLNNFIRMAWKVKSWNENKCFKVGGRVLTKWSDLCSPTGELWTWIRDNLFRRIVENYVTLLLKQFNFTKMSRQFNWTGRHFSEMCQNLASPSIPGNWNGFCLYLLDILRNVECKAPLRNSAFIGEILLVGF